MDQNRKDRIRLHNVPALKTFRKELRNQLTPAEAKLWSYLKAKQLEGRKFRRQHSVGSFILDFYCPDEYLAVELDGQSHVFLSARDYDRKKDEFLMRIGIRVLRFENELVFKNPEYVMNQIKQNFGWRGAPSPEPLASCGDNHPGLRPPLLEKEGS